eukprot:452026-Amorphochlora_amoeboformis.AAC.1
MARFAGYDILADELCDLEARYISAADAKGSEKSVEDRLHVIRLASKVSLYCIHEDMGIQSPLTLAQLAINVLDGRVELTQPPEILLLLPFVDVIVRLSDLTQESAKHCALHHALRSSRKVFHSGSGSV